MNGYTHLLLGSIIGLWGATSGIYASYRRAKTGTERRLVLALGLGLVLLFSGVLAAIV